MVSVFTRLASFLAAWIFRDISLAYPSASNSGVIFVSMVISNVSESLYSSSLILSSSFIIWDNSSFGCIGVEIVALARGHFIPICALSRCLSVVDTIFLAVSISVSRSLLIKDSSAVG